MFVGGSRVFQTGIRLPAGHGGVAYAPRREMGEALANGMLDLDDGTHTCVVAAPRAVTFDDVAAALTEASGRPVDYTRVSDEEYVAGMTRSGVPEHLAHRFLGFCADIRDDQLSVTSADLSTLLGREPATLPEALPEVFDL